MPLIEFVTTTKAAQVVKQLSAVRALPAGVKFKMELGEENFEASVPEGKAWGINVVVTVDEIDA